MRPEDRTDRTDVSESEQAQRWLLGRLAWESWLEQARGHGSLTVSREADAKPASARQPRRRRARALRAALVRVPAPR
jgi:hypothetical protein